MLEWLDRRALFLFRLLPRLDLHVLEFTGLEDLTALFALDVFRVLIARDDLNLWMLAWFGNHLLLGWLCGIARRHKLRELECFEKGTRFYRNWPYFETAGLESQAPKWYTPPVEGTRAAIANAHLLWVPQGEKPRKPFNQ